MAERIRKLLARVRDFVGNQWRPPRYPVRLGISISLADDNAASAQILRGYTRDVSANGVAFIVPAIRIGAHYLAGGNRHPLRVTLELPTKPLCFNVVAVRYHQLDKRESEFLIGAHITDIDEDSARCLIEFLSSRRSPVAA